MMGEFEKDSDALTVLVSKKDSINWDLNETSSKGAPFKIKELGQMNLR